MVQNLANVEPFNEAAEPFNAQLKAFIALLLLGLIGSIFSIISSLFSSVSRQATWYTFMISWVVFCTSYLLLFFAGQVYSGRPVLSLCMIQSSLTYAASPFASASALALVVQLFFNVNTTLTRTPVRGQRYWRYLLFLSPYIVFIGVILETIIITFSSPNAEFSASFYCFLLLEDHVPGRITSALDVIFVSPILVLNFLIYRRFCKHRSDLRAGNFTSMFIRVSVFTLFGIVSLIIGLFFFLNAFIKAGNSDTGLVELNIILALIPVAAVIIFGTHKDLLEVWLFWLKKKNSKNNQPDLSAVLRKMKPQSPSLPTGHIQIEYVINIERHA